MINHCENLANPIKENGNAPVRKSLAGLFSGSITAAGNQARAIFASLRKAELPWT
jgi:hypothetical protein